jgi:hypothetical protein
MMHPPFAAPGSRSVQRKFEPEGLPSIQEFLDELPPIEDFVDYGAVDLPPITDFVAEELAVEESVADVSGPTREGDWFEQEQYDADGWAVAGWQDFDWSRAATLGVRSEESDEANSAWDTLDWNIPLRDQQPAGREGHAAPSADEVARALDGIARRIRSGDLVIDQLRGTPPEAAMAAALATLLRMRD